MTGTILTSLDPEEVRKLDVSIHPGCWCLTCPLVHFGFCPYQTNLLLEKEEAVREDVAICGERTTRRPYGELGSVERNFFCCFVCVDSNLGTIISGWGCDTRMSDTIVDLLQERMKNRGDTKQIQLSEKIAEKANDINEKVDLIQKYLETSPNKFSIDDR